MHGHAAIHMHFCPARPQTEKVKAFQAYLTGQVEQVRLKYLV